MAQPPTLFGIVSAGLPVLTTPSDVPTPTSFLYAIPPPPATTTAAAKPSTHVVVFLLPGVVLPPGTAAAIYLVPPGAGVAGPGTQQQPRFLGGIGPGKESAIFKLSLPTAVSAAMPTILGISIEDASSVAAQMESRTATTTNNNGLTAETAALVPARPPTLLLAQRIIQNAFNFLASYSSGSNSSGGSAGGEMVPLRAFEEWWRKFEGRLRSDPTFLERAVEQ